MGKSYEITVDPPGGLPGLRPVHAATYSHVTVDGVMRYDFEVAVGVDLEVVIHEPGARVLVQHARRS